MRSSVHKFRGFTLIELIIFIIVIAIATTGLFAALNQHNLSSVNPIYQVRALELAQATMDEIISKRYDHASPNGGFPPCDSGEDGRSPCDSSESASFDDVDDFDGFSPVLVAPYIGFTLNVSVELAGDDLGFALSSQAKLIRVTVTPPVGYPIDLAAYRANF